MSKDANRNGTKGILDFPERVEKIKELIVEFDENENTGGKISYFQAFEVVKRASEQKLIDFPHPSYTWWKTKGKHIVDEYNQVKKKHYRLTEKQQLDVVDIKDVIEKHHGNKAELYEYLSPVDDLIGRFVEDINKLEESKRKLTDQLKEKDNIIKEQEEKITQMQAFLDSLFYAHISEYDLKQIIKTKKIHDKALEYSIKETFGNPALYIKEFSKRVRIEDEPKKDNVIPFQTKESEPEKDDYHW